MREVTVAEKELYIETAKQLKGEQRRAYMARVVRALGRGGQRYAERELEGDRNIIRKGEQELTSGFICYDNCQARGRKRTEARLPNLVADIKAIADQHSQTDPSFKSSRLYLRLSANSVRQELIKQQGYTDEQLPSPEIIRQRLNELGYSLKRVKKVNP
jgi:Rhodopirellula transposase DDE domain